MTDWIKERTDGLPWKSVLLSGLFFCLGMSVFYLLLDYFGVREWNEKLYSEIVGWHLIGMALRYSSWRLEGHLERKNARWRKNKDRA